MKTLFLSCSLLFLILACDGQTFEVLYAQIAKSVDTTLYTPLSPDLKGDTLAKWSLMYSNGASIFKQTLETPEETEIFVKNKETGNIDNIITYNMSRNNISYTNHLTGEVKCIYYFFDIQYVIEDKLLNYEWTFLNDEKLILNKRCKHAKAIYPLDKDLIFDVWYVAENSIPSGPLDFNGLPGLILEVNRNGIPFYKAISIKHFDKNEEIKIEKPQSTIKAVTFEEYQKIRFGVPFTNHNKQPPLKRNN